MNYHNTTEAYLPPVINIGIRQHLQGGDVRNMLGGPVMWRAVGKIAMVLLPLVMVINLLLASAIDDIGLSFSTVDNQRHELMDKNIELLARKARLGAPDTIMQVAGDKFALYSASGDQIERLN